MKKLALLGLSVFALTACSTTTLKSSPPKKLNDLKHICIKDSDAPKIPQFTKLIAENLTQRGITSEIKTEVSASCHYALAYSLNTNAEGLISSAKLRLSSINGDYRKSLGETSYWLKGDEEKMRVAKTGLKGQVDTIVNELLKNN
ncbi:hypothetical protein A1D29_01415 [Pasteurellaceae bacterium Orientalotternb1]|nr:hypothetical protein A1D29_01415 [Pasteurellaceae bacterium Orientalotternb1]